MDYAGFTFFGALLEKSPDINCVNEYSWWSEYSLKYQFIHKFFRTVHGDLWVVFSTVHGGLWVVFSDSAWWLMGGFF